MQTRSITPAKNREYRLRAEARFPEKVRARWKTHDAIKAGKLVRAPCATCGALPVEAHHIDYSKPLEVIWLCKKHHADVHRGSQKPKRTEAWKPKRRPFKAPSDPSRLFCKRGHNLMTAGVYVRKRGVEECGECKRLASNSTRRSRMRETPNSISFRN